MVAREVVGSTAQRPASERAVKDSTSEVGHQCFGVLLTRSVYVCVPPMQWLTDVQFCRFLSNSPSSPIMPTLYHSLILLTNAALKPRAPRLPAPAPRTDLQVPAMPPRKRAHPTSTNVDQPAQLADFTADLFSAASEDEVSEAEIALAEQLLAPSHPAHGHSLSNSSSDTNLAANRPALSGLLDELLPTLASSIGSAQHSSISAAARGQHAAPGDLFTQHSQGFLTDDDLSQGHDAQPLLNKAHASAEQQVAAQPLPASLNDRSWSIGPASTEAHLAHHTDPDVTASRQHQQASLLTPGTFSPFRQHKQQQASQSHPHSAQLDQHAATANVLADPSAVMNPLTAWPGPVPTTAGALQQPLLQRSQHSSAPAVEASSHLQNRGQAGQSLQQQCHSSGPGASDDQEQLLVPNPLAADFTDLHHWGIDD